MNILTLALAHQLAFAPLNIPDPNLGAHPIVANVELVRQPAQPIPSIKTLTRQSFSTLPPQHLSLAQLPNQAVPEVSSQAPSPEDGEGSISSTGLDVSNSDAQPGDNQGLLGWIVKAWQALVSIFTSPSPEASEATPEPGISTPIDQAEVSEVELSQPEDLEVTEASGDLEVTEEPADLEDTEEPEEIAVASQDLQNTEESEEIAAAPQDLEGTEGAEEIAAVPQDLALPSKAPTELKPQPKIPTPPDLPLEAIVAAEQGTPPPDRLPLEPPARPVTTEPIDHSIIISPDVAQLHLASTDALGRESTLDPASFQPAAGPRFHPDGSVSIRVLVGNEDAKLYLIGDLNNWGIDTDLTPYQLHPAAENPLIHEITLPPGDYHKMQYRLVDQLGHQRLDMNAALFATPAFNERFYEDRPDNGLNAVLWKPTPIPAAAKAERPDLRGQQLVLVESDPLSLAMRWECSNPESKFVGSTGIDHLVELYQFIGECGIPEQLAELGYNAIQFMPLDTHIDFYDPYKPNDFPDWRFSYQTLNFYGKHADFGSPDELRFMINAFHQANMAVILDVVYSHFPAQGNNPPREFAPYGFLHYRREDGRELYGGPLTEWQTRRFYYTPTIRQTMIDAALINILDYGFDGLRIDNINGIDSEPYGRVLLRDLADAVLHYEPKAVLIGEGYFGDPDLNQSITVGGAGLITTYSDAFYLWYTEQLLKCRDEIDMWALNDILNTDWPRTLLYYPGNHDEFANAGNPFQARGRYLSEAIGGSEFHKRKIRSWSALPLFASAYYLDMLQMWTLQPGDLNVNAGIDWERLDQPDVMPLTRFQAEMKEFFATEPAFAPYNIHRHMVHWIDDVNQVVVFERIDFASGRHVYVAINLGDQAIEQYQIRNVNPEGAVFAIALDSDRSDSGEQARNPSLTQSEDHQLEVYLGSYGVVGLVQQDPLQPISEWEQEPIAVEVPEGSYYRDDAWVTEFATNLR